MVDLDMKKLGQTEEDEEYPLKIRQDLYISSMEYSISDHKPVVGIFTLEVRNWLNTHTLYSQLSGIVFELNNACFIMGTNPIKTTMN